MTTPPDREPAHGGRSVRRDGASASTGGDGRVVVVVPLAASFDGDRWRCSVRVEGPGGRDPETVGLDGLAAAVAERAVPPDVSVAVRWRGGRDEYAAAVVTRTEAACRAAGRIARREASAPGTE